MSRSLLCLLLPILAFMPVGLAGETPYFAIQVVDEETGRGVPMVELKTVNNILYYTDSQGYVAFHEPGLMDTPVFFTVTSPGYEYPKNGFGFHGLQLQPRAGAEALLKIHRINKAERLYRVTGQGIYRDSVLLGRPVPLRQPVLNGMVMGQDSTLAIPYKDKIYWFWGDTNRPSFPLGNFMMSGATSSLPEAGGLPPEQGIDLHYFIDDSGFSKRMSPIKDQYLIWLDGLLTVNDSSGQERLAARYTHLKGLGTILEHGLVVFDDSAQEFKHWATLDLAKEWQAPRGHIVQGKGMPSDAFYFCTPFPNVRVPANWNALADQAAYEAFTCLREGTRYQGKESNLERTKEGLVVYRWSKKTDPIGPKEEKELIAAGLLQLQEAHFLPIDREGGKPVQIHGGTVRWNEYRQKWILIGVEIGNELSLLGEVWYAEADALTGPWKSAIKIASHPHYSFYNPIHHPFFDQENGRFLYFEGTYVNTFSGNPTATPRYDYNQLMYRLDVANIN